jgi:GNAT superfamily N-acetyltransferase
LYSYLGFQVNSIDGVQFVCAKVKDQNFAYPDWVNVQEQAGSKLEFRFANQEDYDIICGLAKVTKFIKDFPGMSYRWGWENKVRVALVDGVIAGFHYFNICQSRPWANSYYIYSSPDFRGLGIPTKLFAKFLTDSRDAGKPLVKWLVGKTNSAAYDFYKYNGIVPVSTDAKHFVYELRLDKQGGLL